MLVEVRRGPLDERTFSFSPRDDEKKNCVTPTLGLGMWMVASMIYFGPANIDPFHDSRASSAPQKRTSRYARDAVCALHGLLLLGLPNGLLSMQKLNTMQITKANIGWKTSCPEQTNNKGKSKFDDDVALCFLLSHSCKQFLKGRHSPLESVKHSQHDSFILRICKKEAADLYYFQ